MDITQSNVCLFCPSAVQAEIVHAPFTDEWIWKSFLGWPKPHCLDYHDEDVSWAKFKLQPFQEDDEMEDDSADLTEQDVFEMEVPAASLIAIKALKQIKTKLKTAGKWDSSQALGPFQNASLFPAEQIFHRQG